MKPYLTFLSVVSMSAVLLGAASPVLANKITSEAVDDITFNGVPNSIDLTVKDMSGGNSLAGVNVQPVTKHLTIPVTSIVKCAKSSFGYAFSKIGFGAFNPTFLDANIVQQQSNPHAGFTEWSKTRWITEAPATHLYTVMLDSLKNPAKPGIELDVMKEFNAALDAFIQQGGTKLDFLKANRTIEVNRNVSVLGACWKTISAKGFATYTKPIKFRIKYQGNPQLFAVNAQLGPMAHGGIQAGEQPMKITTGRLQPFSPNYSGTCPAGLKFRVGLSGVGNGAVIYRITENSVTVYESPSLPFKNGKLQNNFTTNIAYQGQLTLNKKIAHAYKLHVKFKDEKVAQWPGNFQLFDQQAWTHTCTPTVSVGLGGAPGGNNQIAPAGSGASVPQIQAPVNTPPKPVPGLTPAQQTPSPAMQPARQLGSTPAATAQPVGLQPAPVPPRNLNASQPVSKPVPKAAEPAERPADRSVVPARDGAPGRAR